MNSNSPKRTIQTAPCTPSTVHIVINGELAVVPHQTVSFTEVVAIAYPAPPSPCRTAFTVSYGSTPRAPRHEGLLVDSQARDGALKKDGTTFESVIAGQVVARTFSGSATKGR